MAAQARINLPDIDDQAETDEIEWQRYRCAAAGLDVGELIDAVCREVQGDSGDSPLVHLIAGWLESPEWDWDKPQVTPMLCESLGRYLAGIAADVVSQEIESRLFWEGD